MSKTNQCRENFKETLKTTLGCNSAEKGLIRLQKQGCCYQQVSMLTGFKVSTVRKWCRYYKVSLGRGREYEERDILYKTELMQQLQKKELNIYNFLSRRWI